MSGVLRRCACLAVVFACAVAGFALAAAPATAAEHPAPWFIGDPNTVGGWFTFGGGTVTSGDTVTLQRSVTPSGTDPATVFASEAGPGGTTVWPASGDAGGFHFERTAECSFASSSCAYIITGPEESGVVFGSGTPPSASGFPTAGGVTTPTTQPPTTQPPTTVPNPGQVVGKATFIPGAGGTPDTATFDATGSSAPGGAPITGYTWKLQPHNASNPSLTIPCTMSICSLPSGMTLVRGETYDVTLSLSYAGGTLDSPSAQPFAIPAPDPPADPNPGGGTPTGGGGAPSGGAPPAGSGGGGGAGVFARPVSRVPSALTGGTGATAPTIVWLWRPDFYQSDAKTLPQTGGVPELKGKANIIVDTGKQPTGASAGPWLAGLALFALVGGWSLFRRRMRLRNVEV